MGENEEVESKAPLKQGSLKQSLKPRTSPSRTLSEQRCTDLLIHLQTPFPKPRCCPRELPPHHEPHAGSEGITPGVSRVSPMKLTRNAHSRLLEVTHSPGKHAVWHCPFCPCFLFGKQQRRSRWLCQRLAVVVSCN